MHGWRTGRLGVGLLTAMALGCSGAASESPEGDTGETTSTGSTSGTASASSGSTAATDSGGDSTSGGAEESSTTGAAFEASVSMIVTQRDADDVLSVVRIDYADGVFEEPEMLTSDVSRFVSFLELSPGASAITYQTFDPGDPAEGYIVGLDDGRPLTTSHLTDPMRPEFTVSRVTGLTPDESQIVFGMSVPDGGPSRTYVAPVMGGELGTPHALTEVGAPGVSAFSFSADSARMASQSYYGLQMASLADPFEVTEFPAIDPSFYVGSGPQFADGDDVVWYGLIGKELPTRQLFYVDVSASQPWSAVSLHSGPGNAGRPTASPDRRWLTYTVQDGETIERYVVRFDGTDVTAPTALGSWIGTYEGLFDATWSVDSSTLAFRGSASADEIYVVDMLGDTPGQPVLVSSPEVPGEVFVGQPELDRDSAWVYYTRATSESSTLYRASVTGGLAKQPQAVSDGQSVVTNGFRHITLSPDGMGAVFIEQPDSMWLEYAVWYVDLSGPTPAEPVRLASDFPLSGTAAEPQWSSDSQSVIFDISANGSFGPQTYYLVDRSTPDTPVELGIFEDVIVIDPVPPSG